MKRVKERDYSALLVGAATVLNVGATVHVPPAPRSLSMRPDRADYLALRADGQKVFGDTRVAYERYARSHPLP